MKHDTSIPLMRDLYSAYLQIVKENSDKGITMTRLDICRILSTIPAPRLYISVDFARRIIRTMEKGRQRAHSPWRFRQHHELFKRYLALPLERRNTAGIKEILSRPAPSFYLSPHRINYLLYKSLRA